LAVITNLYEDHLDFHGDTASYYAAKANIFGNGAQSLVCTPAVIDVLKNTGITDFPPSMRVLSAASDELADDHNAVNFGLAALAVSERIGRPVSAEEVDAAKNTYQPLPHRQQLVRTTGRVRWIDDTLATTGESVVAALKAMRACEHVVLIVGGLDRQLSYDQVDAYLLSGLRRVSLIQGPTNGSAIGRGFVERYPASCHRVDTLQQAVQLAASLPDVDVVLLSPGAASYDLYANYEAKAAAFRRFIDELPASN
jgi:UDP-N-acetylmuramoylalanine--D-glutamate ligase